VVFGSRRSRCFQKLELIGDKMSRTKPGRVDKTGATAGELLVGDEHVNRGLLLRVREAQEKQGGPVTGRFTVLAAGKGKYARHLEAHECKDSDADQLIEEISSEESIKTLHIFNRNMLKVLDL
jgi:hypothetical protein